MHKGKRGVLFVFSGPSGVGKGTLKAKLFEEFADQIAYSVSATTRGPREGEVDGKDYFFISRQEFERRVKNNEFLEHAEFAGNCYGTPRAYVGQRHERRAGDRRAGRASGDEEHARMCQRVYSAAEL